ncbi:MAG: glycoside hydrolase 15-like protein [Candidatus Peregrinibacteria bacterium Gr01-1014_25]|nr:MAG: glycoside hydrolase 15-like protein [Candidatus Peregrinibacteria bacterium Gr01-1014_25]
MPRSYILGNGSVLATFDARAQMRDLYFPHVGSEDHTAFGNMHRVGVWVDGKGFAWLDDPAWQIASGYVPETLVGRSTLRHEGLAVDITAEDCVHPVHNILLRQFAVRTTDGQQRRIRFFFNHNFHIYGDKQKDTAFYEPYTNSVIHYRQSRYFLVGGDTSWPESCRTNAIAGQYASVLKSAHRLHSCGLASFTTGKAQYRGLEGTWRDAEDGNLSENPIEQGSVDSTVGIHCIADGNETDVTLWLCLARSLDEVVQLQQIVLEQTPQRLLRNAHNYWKSWVNKTHRSFGSLSPEIVNLYKRSLLTIRAHVDHGGGILAAADADIMLFNRDTYTYVWPRDGSFVSMVLDDAGYSEVSHRFFEFCATALTPDGYLLHKYNPDGSLGSSWHPWYRDGEAQLPIQEDETALVIAAIWRHFTYDQDFEFLQNIFERFVQRAAEFLCNFREKDTALPLPSYDPWEEERGVFTYTVCCTIAGLVAASNIAQALGHERHARRYRKSSDEMRDALVKHLYDEQKGRFLKKIIRRGGSTVERDDRPDASIAVLWTLGVLPPDDPRVVSTMTQLRQLLAVHAPVGGMARYTGDHYHAAVEPSADVPGNPWVITTLWDAQWDIALAKTPADLERPREALSWAAKFANPAGMLPEQLHPVSGAHLSVSPLTWSHAVFADTVLRFVAKEEEMKTSSK